VYNKILDLLRKGSKIILLEPDGPLHQYYPEGREVDMELLVSLQTKTVGENGKYMPYGHGYVLALTLLEDLN
jgi:hypothetical protein